jgi:hypothetical protein
MLHQIRIEKFNNIDAYQLRRMMSWPGGAHNKKLTPRLSMLARVILALPATSAPSERIFTTAGLTVNAKRSSIAPSAVDKIVFVHENSHLVKKRTD